MEEASARQFSDSEKELVDGAMSTHIIGSAESVHEGLTTLVKPTDAGELMLSTRIHSFDASAHSLELGGAPMDGSEQLTGDPSCAAVASSSRTEWSGYHPAMMERSLIGIDIQPIDEVQRSLQIFGDRYRRRLFTDHELEYCGDGPTTASRLAERFAAKEAVLKILDVGEFVPTWRSIEVRCSASGRPEIVLYGEAAALAQLQGVHSLSLSLSRGGGIAVATVVATLTSSLAV